MLVKNKKLIHSASKDNQDHLDQHFTLAAFFPYQVRLYYKAVNDVLRASYSQYNLSSSEWRVITILNEVEPTTANQIIEHSSMNKVRVSRAIASLEKAKIINRVQDKQDKRRVLISLNTKGKRLLNELMPIMKKLETGLTSCLTTDEAKQLDYLMTKVKTHAHALLPEKP
jgi:DNA-binding MarR family transcriptional regulator